VSDDLTYGDAVAAALEAEAEAARAEIRKAGITCPSCGVNLADLPDDHELVLSDGYSGTAKCGAGQVVDWASARWDDFVNAVTVTAAKAAAEACERAVVGEPGTKPNFTGLLDTLGQS
jgi:hypothetical protein